MTPAPGNAPNDLALALEFGVSYRLGIAGFRLLARD